ncbi:MAG: HAD family phosphatase [Promethearchaeota archaeon]|nr:MAG: HAD family phosphatase [Candidatus Lokiarchaeota archaeon]
MSAGRISSRTFLEMIFEHFYEPLKKTGGALPPKHVNIEYYLELWFELYSRATDLSPEMAEIIKRLHKAGYTVSLLSNTYDIHAKSNELQGFFALFDHVFLSSEIGMRKPEIEKYKYVLKQLDAKAKQCIFIDDKLMNLVPARKLGMTVIQFKSFELFRDYLNELGIEEIDKDLKTRLKDQYKHYKTTKKEYKKAKKEYKKAKKKYKKAKKKRKKKKITYLKYRKLKKRYEFLKKVYKHKKEDYKHTKKMKKATLEPRLKLEKPAKS